MEFAFTLLLQPADVAAFRHLALLKQYAVDKSHSRQLSGTYFDTSDLHLKEHGMALCVRREGRGWIAILTAARGVAMGLHQRLQWEARLDGPRPDLGALAALVEPRSKWARALAAPALAKVLVPMFDVELRRTVWPLRLLPGVEVALTLDQGKLRRGDASEPISEVGFALKEGDPAALFDFVLLLQGQVPLRLDTLSQAERGYALNAPQSSTAVKAEPVLLDSSITVEEGLQVIVGNCLMQMQCNEVGVMQGIDPESVHQMRVGMRRLRSALRLFAKWIAFPEALQGELAWLGAELGAARDADVLVDSTLAKVAEACPMEGELLRLQQFASTIARAKRQQAALAVGSVRYSSLLLGLVSWLRGSRWQESLGNSVHQALAAPLDKCAKQILARRHKKLLESGKRLKNGTPEERHRVRIAAKKARYATEFFQSLPSEGRVKRYVTRLTALQDALGWLNDAAVADRLLRKIEQRQPELAGIAAFARGCLCAGTKQDVRELDTLWKEFSAMEPP